MQDLPQETATCGIVYRFSESVVHEAACLLWPPQTKSALHRQFARYLQASLDLVTPVVPEFAGVRCPTCAGDLLEVLFGHVLVPSAAETYLQIVYHWTLGQHQAKSAAFKVRGTE